MCNDSDNNKDPKGEVIRESDFKTEDEFHKAILESNFMKELMFISGNKDKEESKDQ